MKVISIKEYRIKTKFLNEDFDKIAFDKGLILEPNEKNKYDLNIFDVIYSYSLEEILNLKDDDGYHIFKKYENNFSINVSEKDVDDDIVKDWRIQLDVKTSSKNIKEIYRAIEIYIIPKIEKIN
jgi:hypothetical protein